MLVQSCLGAGDEAPGARERDRRRQRVCESVGAYQAAIADAADLEGLDDATTLERDAFVFRCYVELGSHEVRGEKRRAIDRLRD